MCHCKRDYLRGNKNLAKSTKMSNKKEVKITRIKCVITKKIICEGKISNRREKTLTMA